MASGEFAIFECVKASQQYLEGRQTQRAKRLSGRMKEVLSSGVLPRGEREHLVSAPSIPVKTLIPVKIGCKPKCRKKVQTSAEQIGYDLWRSL